MPIVCPIRRQRRSITVSSAEGPASGHPILDPKGMGQTQWATRWLSRPEARCSHYWQSVSPDRSPNLGRSVAQLVRVDSSVERPLRSVDPLPESGVGSGVFATGARLTA